MLLVITGNVTAWTAAKQTNNESSIYTYINTHPRIGSRKTKEISAWKHESDTDGVLWEF